MATVMHSFQENVVNNVKLEGDSETLELVEELRLHEECFYFLSLLAALTMNLTINRGGSLCGPVRY